MIRTWTDVEEIPELDDGQVTALASAEYDRMSEVLHALTPDDWGRQTPCAAWHVHALVAHVVGATDQYTSIRKGLAGQVRAQWRARRTGEALVDALTGSHVDRYLPLAPEELVQRFDALRGAAVRGRGSLPALLGRTSLDDGFGNTFPLRHLMRVVATRDCWMHRDDLARATDRAMRLTPEHDGVVVADVVREWVARHGRPFRLELTGPAGGGFRAGRDGEELSMDAVAFCRAASGRTPGGAPLGQGVPF
jgi:uncharacterized protein (TIGR03083 family)